MTQWNKKQRNINRLKLVLVLLGSLILFVKGYWLTALLMLVILYLLQEILYSDHIFYDPGQDYIYQFDADIMDAIDLSNHTIKWDKAYLNKTIVLNLQLKFTLWGYFFDPYIEVTAGNNKQRQYFERRLSGTRILNLSHINTAGLCSEVLLDFSGCKPCNTEARLFGFINRPLQDKNILVLSPHADDAEIAAFGLYSQNRSFITTLTAGEIEADYYKDSSTDKAAASRFKGRLRAWDSIFVPQWAGLYTNRVIQLGYFCLTLGQMYNKPAQEISSYTANLKDTRFFRIFNAFSLQSDAHGHSTWNSLLDDLTELIVKFQPDIILTPHPLLDPHKDHYYATVACWQVCNKLDQADTCSVDDFLLYANHYNHTDMFPFGLSGSLCSVPPEFDQHRAPVRLFSYACDHFVQKNKQAALGMMHDLTIPVSFKKKFRHWIQHYLLQREKYTYADDEYFRKSIRANELFYKVNRKQLGQLVIKNESDRNDSIKKTESTES